MQGIVAGLACELAGQLASGRIKTEACWQLADELEGIALFLENAEVIINDITHAQTGIGIATIGDFFEVGDAIAIGIRSDFHRHQGVEAEVAVLNAEVQGGWRVGHRISGLRRGITGADVIREGRLFTQRVIGKLRRGGEVEAFIGNDRTQAAVRQDVAEVAAVGLDGVAVATLGHEVQGHDPDHLRSQEVEQAVLKQRGHDLVVFINEGHGSDAAAHRTVRIPGEGHAGDVREASLVRPGGDAMLQDGFQPLRRGVKGHQAVVKPECIFHIQLGDAALGLAHGRVGQRRQFFRASRLAGNRADLGTDTTAVLHGDNRNIIANDGAESVAIGIGGNVAQVGLLAADEAALAFQIDIGIAKDLAILGIDHGLHGIRDGLDRCALGARGKGRGGEVILRRVPGGGDIGRRGRISAVGGDAVSQIGDDDFTGWIELHRQAAKVSILIVRIDDERRLAVCPGGEDGVGVGKVSRVAREGHGHIVFITQAGVGSGGEDDVHTGQLGGQQTLVGKLLEVGEKDDFGHAFRRQFIDVRLHMRGQQVHVIHTGGSRREALGKGAAWGGDGTQDLRGHTDDADLLTTLGDDRCRHQAGLHRRSLRHRRGRSIQSHIGEPGIGSGIRRVIQVGRNVRELRANPGTIVTNGIHEDIRAQVPLVVANGRGLHTDHVMNGDVRAGKGGGADARNRAQ